MDDIRGLWIRQQTNGGPGDGLPFFIEQHEDGTITGTAPNARFDHAMSGRFVAGAKRFDIQTVRTNRNAGTATVLFGFISKTAKDKPDDPAAAQLTITTVATDGRDELPKDFREVSTYRRG